MRTKHSIPTLVAMIGGTILVGDCLAGALKVETDFPGGSGNVEIIDQYTRTIRMKPTSHRDRGWVCWWYIKVTGITPGETISIDLGDAPWATPDQAAFSVDNETWLQTSSAPPSAGTWLRPTTRNTPCSSAGWPAS